jgi:hypothetical protein
MMPLAGVRTARRPGRWRGDVCGESIHFDSLSARRTADVPAVDTMGMAVVDNVDFHLKSIISSRTGVALKRLAMLPWPETLKRNGF